jgi:hypothetical protein
MLDGKAYKALSSDGTDSDLIPRLCHSALVKAFAALEDDLRIVIGKITTGESADPIGDQR